jgi:hypothetical protein
MAARGASRDPTTPPDEAVRWRWLVLAVICVGLALAWRDQRQETACWRAAFEDDEIPAAGRCD